MSDSSELALASSDEELDQIEELKLPSLEKRTSSTGPRRTYMIPDNDTYRAVENVKPVVNLSKRGVNVFVRFRPDNA